MLRDLKTQTVLIIFLFFAILNRAKAEETLNWFDCVKEAAANHPDLIAAVEVVNQSVAAKKITASALYPQVTSNLDATTGETKTSTSKSTSDTYSYGISGSQLVFDAFKTVNNVNAAKENIKSSQESYRFTSSEVRLRLRTAFVNLLQAQDAVQVAEDIVKIRRSNLELITMRYESGLEHRGALLTAEANLAAANFELSQAYRDIELAQRQLIKEMGRKEFKPMRVSGDFIVSDDAKKKPVFEEIATQHPSLKQITAQKNSAAFGIKSAYANYAPQLTGTAGINKSDSHWPPKNNQWDLGLGITLPIFEGGLRSAQVAQAKALFNQLVANERSTRDGIIVSLEQTWVLLQDAVENVSVQYKTLIATEERSKIAEAEYSTGFISYDNWTIIEDNLVTAKRQYLNSQANALLAEANWIQAKGETLEYAQ